MSCWLSYRCQFLKSHGKKSEPNQNHSGFKPKSNFNRPANTFVNSNTNSTCTYCNSNEHNIATCSTFLSLLVSERFNFVKRNGHCINCLRKGHLVSKCPSKSRCHVCQSVHHSTLHIFVVPDHSGIPSSEFGLNQRPSTSNGNPVSLVALSFKRTIIRERNFSQASFEPTERPSMMVTMLMSALDIVSEIRATEGPASLDPQPSCYQYLCIIG